MGWLDFATALIQKIPIERIMFPPKNENESLEQLVRIVRASEGQRSGANSAGKGIGIKVENKPPQNAPPVVSDMPPSPYENLAGELPTSEETRDELKRRLAKELYRAELDLQAKLRIAGKPCDCLDLKHTLGIEAAAEELVSHEPDNPVYTEIITYLRTNQPKFAISAIGSGRFDSEYPRMASDFREFRKKVVGTLDLTSIGINWEVKK